MSSVYTDRRVLVTGHTGFKGSWLSAWLAQFDARVSGLALAPATTPALYTEAALDSRIDSHLADIREPAAVDAVFAATRPEIVFHLAAQSLVRAGYADPIGTYATNVMGTAHVLDAARHHGVKAVVVVTSDKCYAPPPPTDGYRESDALGGHDPYSSSKACAELLTASWRDSFSGTGDGPLIASARAGNVIGGGDWAADRLVPDLIRAALAGTTTPIRNPQAIRPWQHVLEPLAGYLRLGARLLAGDAAAARAWNFGPEATDMQPVAVIAERLCARLDGHWQPDANAHPHEAAVLRLDSTDARTRLGWAPRWPLDTALDAVADWHRRHAAGEAALELMTEQLAAYGPPLESAP
ncbi:CDP-glucose 4,6-dehydratase [Nitrogeniibacter mangrovi]|uniref:CDP-glucose 4,6-dehydratase n=1 Tax=Nitrogeniibacter mangrovi TaxID=2016596 RepID=A0A6C1B3A1_9RHOO|nr:CDP-glucose 4,6-dehydratase [Nitrogeniibacter mangrovi]QID17335.1 CDP-glucose 4,6-dehydratase [Nitrogeniibacter mangrovi]